MTRLEAILAAHEIQCALVLANKWHTCEEFEEALTLATRLIFFLREHYATSK